MTSAAGLLESLKQKSFALAPQAESFILARAPSVPFGANLLAAIGGFFSALPLMFFFTLSGLLELEGWESEQLLLVWGAVSIGFALCVYHAARHYGSTLFIRQFAFAFMLAGKIMMSVGAMFFFDESIWAATFMASGLTFLLWFFFPLLEDRFLSTLGSLIFFWGALFETGGLGALHGLVLDLGFVAQAAAVYFLLTHEKRPFYGLNAFAYGLLVSLCLNLFMLTFETGWPSVQAAPHPLFLQFFFGFSLLALVNYLMQEAPHQETGQALAGALLLGLLFSPGICLAVFMLLLGHRRGEVGLACLGFLALCVFLLRFYAVGLDFWWHGGAGIIEMLNLADTHAAPQKTSLLLMLHGLLLLGASFLIGAGKIHAMTGGRGWMIAFAWPIFLCFAYFALQVWSG